MKLTRSDVQYAYMYIQSVRQVFPSQMLNKAEASGLVGG